jgi:phage shock protein A
MAFNPLQLRFIRFLGPEKEPAEYTFTSGLNILWGSSDTGKTFLVESIDFMLGANDQLKDIPERVGYERILLGLTAGGKDYTIHRSINGGAFKRFDGLLQDLPDNPKSGKALSAVPTSKNFNNLSNWLLQELGLDGKEILYSKTTGKLKALGFRALAHLCVIVYPTITKTISPVLSGQWTEGTREYGVFKLLLTGNDDAAITPETAAEIELPIPVSKPPARPDVLEQMIDNYEEELAKLTDKPEGLDAEETTIEEELEKLKTSIESMEGQISQTSQQRKVVHDRHTQLGVRRNEISELQDRFKLLDAQYTNDIKRLVAIEESGQLFVLREPMACPLCGAAPEGQNHSAACDGNVAAVAQAAAAEIAKIRTLQAELHSTVAALTKEQVEVIGERKTLESEWKQYQQQMAAALSPDFTAARKRHDELIEKRSTVREALVLYKRIKNIRRRLDEPTAAPPEKPEEKEKADPAEVDQYIPKSVLRNFSKTVERILTEWHFPGATDVYFDEVKRDVVIGGRLRGSRGAGLCAITYSAFTLALFEYCRSRKMPHPGFVILDSPLIAYKEPKVDDEGIAGTDLKLRFYEQLEKFAGAEQIFVVDNTDPPASFLAKATQFTKNPAIPRCGLFPCLPKEETKT